MITKNKLSLLIFLIAAQFPQLLLASEQENSEKYQSYIKYAKKNILENLITTLNDEFVPSSIRPKDFPDFSENAQIDITVTIEESTSTVNSYTSLNPKYNHDKSNNILYFDNTIIDKCFLC